MAVTINTISTEILELILRSLINNELDKTSTTLSSKTSTLTSPPFTSIFCVCQAWYGVALPLLWADVVLRSDRVKKFTAGITPSNVALIQSLTQHSTPMVDYEPFRWINESHEAHLGDLQALAGVLPMMMNLNTFLLTCRSHDDIDRPYFPRKVIHLVLDELPFSVENLQVHIPDSLTRETDESHHLCAVLGRLLCHAKHVRLCLGMFYPTLFDVVMGAKANDFAAEGPMSSSSQLQTAVFNATYMEDFELCPSTAEFDFMSNESYNSAKTAFLQRAQECIAADRFPALRRFVFFDSLNRIGNSFDAIVERDLIKKTTKCYPKVAKDPFEVDEDLPGFLHMCRYQGGKW
jgi:hypothetical protein